jgi:arylsulfatase A
MRKPGWFIVLGILLGFQFQVSNFGATPSRPNVVFIYADDMGYGEVQALNPKRGLISTPHLDKMMADGMTFTDAHTTSAVCTPSRYGLLTGRYNWRTRLQAHVVRGGKPCLIAPDRMTLGNLFQQQGYNTAIVGKWHLDYQYEIPAALKGVKATKRSATHYLSGKPIGTKIVDGPITRGFDAFLGYHHGGSMSSIVKDDTIIKEVHIIDILPLLTDEVVKHIDAKATEAKAGKPFFLYFPMSSPHSPVVPAPEWQGKSGLGAHGDFVMQTDASVGAIVGALERNGLSENTIVIFSADNGTASNAADMPSLMKQGHFSSGDLRGAKTDLWDGGHRVPFILRWPAKVKANTRMNQMISLADMMATFGEMFSAEFADDTAEDSISFLPALYGKPVTNPRESVVHHSSNGRFAIRQGDWKLLLAPGSGGKSLSDAKATAQGLPERQLYNIKDDLGETTNLVAQYPEKVATLIALLESYVAEGRSTPGTVQKNDAKIDIWKKSLNQAKKP